MAYPCNYKWKNDKGYKNHTCRSVYGMPVPMGNHEHHCIRCNETVWDRSWR